jgi:hypothetical protein
MSFKCTLIDALNAAEIASLDGYLLHDDGECQWDVVMSRLYEQKVVKVDLSEYGMEGGGIYLFPVDQEIEIVEGQTTLEDLDGLGHHTLLLEVRALLQQSDVQSIAGD